MSQIYDITIIGGGPEVGLYAAFYAGMRLNQDKMHRKPRLCWVVNQPI